MPEGRLILICGLPGSGKTTLAKQLAPQLAAVRLCPDEWKHDLGIDYYDEQGRVRRRIDSGGSAQELLTLGQSVILENGFWARGERDELRLGRESWARRWRSHYLEAPVEERGGGSSFETMKPGPAWCPSSGRIFSGWARDPKPRRGGERSPP